MRYIIKGKNINIGDVTKEKIIGKLERVSKLFSDETQVTVTISSEKLEYVVEVTIPMSKRLLRAETFDEDMMSAVDKVVDKMESQIVKYKKRLKSKMRQNKAFIDEYKSVLLDEDEVDEEEVSYKIVKNKHFELRPMDAEEAVMQMELLGHSFYVFINGETDEVNVVYRRKDGTFGLIEPEV